MDGSKAAFAGIAMLWTTYLRKAGVVPQDRQLSEEDVCRLRVLDAEALFDLTGDSHLLAVIGENKAWIELVEER